MTIEIFKNGWKHDKDDTECGYGSSIDCTQHLINILPSIIDGFNIKSICDAGCGDLNWMKYALPKGVQYTGYDMFERKSWKALKNIYDLRVADITKDMVDYCNLIICRDVFIHLPNDMICQALEKFRISGQYLLSTTFTYDAVYAYLIDNNRRALEPSIEHEKVDLERHPFNLGQPLLLIPERYPFKYLGLWKL